MKKTMPALAMLAAVWLAGAAGALAAPLSAASDPEHVPDTFAARGNKIAEAWLVAPTRRYDHFVRGNSAEAGGLRVRMADGRVLTLMLGALGMLELAVCWLLGLTPSQERVMRGVLATTLLWTAATLLDRRLLPTAAYYSVDTLLAATLPAWAQPIMTSATVVLVVNGVLAWALLRRRGRRHVPVL